MVALSFGYTIFATISLMSSVTLMWMVSNDYRPMPVAERVHLKNVFWLSFCSFFLNVRVLIHAFGDLDSKYFPCLFSAILGNTFIMATFNWYFLISLSLYFTTRRYSSCWPWRWSIRHLFAWVPSLFFGLLPVAFNLYHNDPKYHICYITTLGTSRLYRLSFVLPTTIYLAFSMYVVVYIYRVIYESETTQKWRIILFRIVTFVGIFVVNWIWKWVVQILIIFNISTYNWTHNVEFIFSISMGILHLMIWIIFLPKYFSIISRRYSSILTRPSSGDSEHIFSNEEETERITTPYNAFSSVITPTIHSSAKFLSSRGDFSSFSNPYSTMQGIMMHDSDFDSDVMGQDLGSSSFSRPAFSRGMSALT